MEVKRIISLLMMKNVQSAKSNGANYIKKVAIKNNVRYAVGNIFHAVASQHRMLFISPLASIKTSPL